MRRIILICSGLPLILLGLNLPAAAQNVTIQLTPQGLPIQIPSSGGSFNYLISMTNNGATNQRAAVWCMITLPDSSTYGPVLGPVRITLSPGQTIERQRTQNIPAGAPTGNYTFNAYVGVYPNTVWDSDSFAFDKMPAGGTELWVAIYNGPGNDDDRPYSMAVDTVGNIYITGTSDDGDSGLCDYATIKYDGSGNQDWAALYNWHANDEAYDLALDIDDNVYVTGRSDGIGTNYDYATIKYDSDGNQLWVARYNGPGNFYDCPSSIAVDSARNAYVTGYQVWSIGGLCEYATVKYDSDGHQVWIATYTGPTGTFNNACALALSATGYVYVTGRSLGFGTWYDYATIKYDADGHEIWVARYNGPGDGDDEPQSLVVDADGNAYVTGRIYMGGNSYRYATIKYDSSGNPLWIETTIQAPPFESFPGPFLALDPSGNVYVTYYCMRFGTGADFVTIKYDTNGTQLWLASYSGPPGMASDMPYDIELDEAGNIYVTSNSSGPFSFACVTIKYDGNGNLVWVANRSEMVPCALALDLSGDVCVTGHSAGDCCTIKYSGGNLDNWLPVEATILGQSAWGGPQQCRLEANYPNPFNASTVLRYKMQDARYISLRVYDTAGRLVETLVDGWRSAGTHELTFDASDLPSGMYFARLEAGDYIGVQKLILLK